MEVATVFLETSLGTRLAVSFPASATTVADLKRRVGDEHAAAFPHIGHIAVQAIKFRMREPGRLLVPPHRLHGRPGCFPAGSFFFPAGSPAPGTSNSKSMLCLALLFMLPINKCLKCHTAVTANIPLNLWLLATNLSVRRGHQQAGAVLLWVAARDRSVRCSLISRLNLEPHTLKVKGHPGRSIGRLRGACC